MQKRDQDRVVEVAGRAKAYAAMDEKYAEAGKAGKAILHAYHSGESVSSGAVNALCASFHSTGLYAGCGEDTQKRLKAVYAVGAFDESKHKRDGGKFATKEGAGGGSEPKDVLDMSNAELSKEYERLQMIASSGAGPIAPRELARLKDVAQEIDDRKDHAEKHPEDAGAMDFGSTPPAGDGGGAPQARMDFPKAAQDALGSVPGGMDSTKGTLLDSLNAAAMTSDPGRVKSHLEKAEGAFVKLKQNGRTSSGLDEVGTAIYQALKQMAPGAQASAAGPVTTEHVRKRDER